jgi:hypothetical protein
MNLERDSLDNASSDAERMAELMFQKQQILEDLYEDAFLTACYHDLLDGRIEQGMRELVRTLDERRLESSETEWSSFQEFCRLHPICKLLHQDPFTFHAFEQQKQHNYAGDPMLLKFIHDAATGGGPPDGTRQLGEQIFKLTTRAPACRGVCHRTRKVAEVIDFLASQMPSPKVLSLAAGHLHEASQCESLRQGRLGHWLALDSEPDNVREIQHQFAGYGVHAELCTVRQILADDVHAGEFDLVFSTGLFDYLQQALARRLTARLFGMLRPGGQLLIANFPEELAGLGYVECFMNLHLVCRNRREMESLVAEIDERQIKDVRLLDEHGSEILLLHVTKA